MFIQNAKKANAAFHVNILRRLRPLNYGQCPAAFGHLRWSSSEIRQWSRIVKSSSVLIANLETKSIVPGKFQERQQQVEDAGRWRRSSYESCVGEFLTPSKGYNAGVVPKCRSARVVPASIDVELIAPACRVWVSSYLQIMWIVLARQWSRQRPGVLNGVFLSDSLSLWLSPIQKDDFGSGKFRAMSLLDADGAWRCIQHAASRQDSPGFPLKRAIRWTWQTNRLSLPARLVGCLMGI